MDKYDFVMSAWRPVVEILRQEALKRVEVFILREYGPYQYKIAQPVGPPWGAGDGPT